MRTRFTLAAAAAVVALAGLAGAPALLTPHVDQAPGHALARARDALRTPSPATATDALLAPTGGGVAPVPDTSPSVPRIVVRPAASDPAASDPAASDPAAASDPTAAGCLAKDDGPPIPMDPRRGQPADVRIVTSRDRPDGATWGVQHIPSGTCLGVVHWLSVDAARLFGATDGRRRWQGLARVAPSAAVRASTRATLPDSVLMVPLLARTATGLWVERDDALRAVWTRAVRPGQVAAADWSAGQ